MRYAAHMDERPTEASLISRLTLDANRLNDTLLQMRAQGLTGTWRIRTHVPETLLVVHMGASHVPRAPVALRDRARLVADNIRSAGPVALARRVAKDGLRRTVQALQEPPT